MNKRIRTSILSAAIVGGTVFGAAQVGGIANAQVDDEPTSTEQSEDPPADTERDGEGRRGHRGFGGALDAVAEVIGIDAEDLRDQVREGSTLGDIADANGVDQSAVVDVIVDSKQERLAQAVEDGRLTQTEADEKAADLEERVTTRVEEGRPERGEGGRSGDRGPRGENAPADASVETDG